MKEYVSRTGRPEAAIERGRDTPRRSTPRHGVPEAQACTHIVQGLRPNLRRQFLAQYHLLLLFVLALPGCSSEEIDRTYGKRRGTQGGASVNGTAVLASMFADLGYRVRTWSRLSPKLEKSQAIVWAPDDFLPPEREHREFLERWLFNEENRTLVYIGRDHDAAIQYWHRAESAAPAEQAVEVARRLARVRSDYDTARTVIPSEKNSDWFTVERDNQRRPVESLDGPWAEGIDAAQVDIEIAARFIQPDSDETQEWVERDEYPWSEGPSYSVLLSSQDEPLVTEIVFSNESRILVVANGSFLLNFPLINHEHCKLAARLISKCQPPGPVVFLQSGSGGPMVLGEDPNANYPTGLEIFTVWPLGIIMLHLAAAGILMCMTLFPIFGPAYTLDRSSPSDFGKHIIALGELLEYTRDRQYAVDRVKYYYEHVRRDSGQSHQQENPLPPSTPSSVLKTVVTADPETNETQQGGLPL